MSNKCCKNSIYDYPARNSLEKPPKLSMPSHLTDAEAREIIVSSILATIALTVIIFSVICAFSYFLTGGP